MKAFLETECDKQKCCCNFISPQQSEFIFNKLKMYTEKYNGENREKFEISVLEIATFYGYLYNNFCDLDLKDCALSFVNRKIDIVQFCTAIESYMKLIPSDFLNNYKKHCEYALNSLFSMLNSFGKSVYLLRLNKSYLNYLKNELQKTTPRNTYFNG